MKQDFSSGPAVDSGGEVIPAAPDLSNSGPHTTIRTPPSIPDHEMVRCIGQGSYGDVWLARTVMGIYRAIKVVYRDRFETARPYEREFQGIRKFEPVSRTHQGLLQILQIGRNDSGGYFYYVMELADDVTHERLSDSTALCPGSYVPHTLRSDTQGRGRLPMAECVDLGLGLAEALEHLHGHGLVHRDIKPSNIIFVNQRPKLADVGLVADTREARSLVGTTGFIPPEGPGTAQADIFSFGKVLYEISTGKDRCNYPEPLTNLAQMPERVQMQEFNEVVLKACETDPARRYQSAEALRADLELLRAGTKIKRK